MSNAGIPQFIAGGIVTAALMFAFNSATHHPDKAPEPCPVPEPISAPQVQVAPPKPQPQASSPLVLEGTNFLPQSKVEFASFNTTYGVTDYAVLDIENDSIREYVDAHSSGKDSSTVSRTASQKLNNNIIYVEVINLGDGQVVTKKDKLQTRQREDFERLMNLQQTIMDQIPEEYKGQGAASVKSVKCTKDPESVVMTCSLNLKYE